MDVVRPLHPGIAPYRANRVVSDTRSPSSFRDTDYPSISNSHGNWLPDGVIAQGGSVFSNQRFIWVEMVSHLVGGRRHKPNSLLHFRLLLIGSYSCLDHGAAGNQKYIMLNSRSGFRTIAPDSPTLCQKLRSRYRGGVHHRVQCSSRFQPWNTSNAYHSVLHDQIRVGPESSSVTSVVGYPGSQLLKLRQTGGSNSIRTASGGNFRPKSPG